MLYYNKVKFRTTRELAAYWSVSEARIRQLLAKKRIKCCIKIGNMWLIPYKAVDPRKSPGWKLGRKRK